MASKFIKELEHKFQGNNYNKNANTDKVSHYNQSENETKAVRIKIESDLIVKNLKLKRNLLYAEDVMVLLGLEKATVYGLFNSPDFPSKLIGKRKYITISNFAEWLASS